MVHILSPETDNCPSWIRGRERITVENINDQSPRKNVADLGGSWTRDLLVSVGWRIQLSHRGQLVLDVQQTKILIRLCYPKNSQSSLIRLHGTLVWSKSSLVTHVQRYSVLRCGLFVSIHSLVRKALTFHANCLLWRQFAWNVKAYFLRKLRKLSLSVCRQLNYTESGNG